MAVETSSIIPVNTTFTRLDLQFQSDFRLLNIRIESTDPFGKNQEYQEVATGKIGRLARAHCPMICLVLQTSRL